MTDFNRIADRVATKLLTRLKAGEIKRIQISTIRAALCLDPDYPHGAPMPELDRLEEVTTRKVVMKAG